MVSFGAAARSIENLNTAATAGMTSSPCVTLRRPETSMKQATEVQISCSSAAARGPRERADSLRMARQGEP
jgi:hypothetical protein